MTAIQATQLMLVTIVAEDLLEPQLATLVKTLGATGFTVTPCSGEGSRGLRTGSMPGGNVRIEVVVSKDVSEMIIAKLAEAYFAHCAVIGWLTPVGVVRGEKYVGPQH